MMPISDNLPQLRDIHLPEGVSVWPLSYGWWILIVGIFTISASFFAIKYLRRKSKKLYALHLLKNISNHTVIPSAAAVSEILRRICIYKYPSAVSLSGNDWVKFLHIHTKAKLSAQAQKLLTESPYMPLENSPYSQQDFDDLLKFCTTWIGENL